MSSNNKQKLLSELEMWEQDLINAAELLEDYKKYDDRGGIAWCQERIRWAKISINNILDYLREQEDFRRLKIEAKSKGA